MKMPETEAETSAQKHRVDQKMAAPVCCLRCEWLGSAGQLMTPGNAPWDEPFHCPRCGETDIKWIENEAPSGLQ